MVDAVSVKLPTFWTSSPSAWFAQAEAHFVLRGVTQDNTKYYHVVAVLDSATATCDLSIFTSPPETEKFKEIQTFIISAFELSECKRATALFNLPELGDSKPSELIDAMLALMGTHKPCFLFKHVFLQQLPNYVRAPLATSGLNDYRALAQESDQIYLSARYHPANIIQEVDDRGQSLIETDTYLSLFL